jgi:hypothetical protein
MQWNATSYTRVNATKNSITDLVETTQEDEGHQSWESTKELRELKIQLTARDNEILSLHS